MTELQGETDKSPNFFQWLGGQKIRKGKNLDNTINKADVLNIR